MFFVNQLTGFSAGSSGIGVTEIVTSQQGGAATTSHTVSLPSNVGNGETLIAIFVETRGASITFPGGWNEFYTAAMDGTGGNYSVAIRDADGTEGASITVTTGATGNSAHIVYRITGAARDADQSPEAATNATGDSTTPDPGSVTPTGGPKSFLFIAVAGIDPVLTLATVSAFPSGYIDGTSSVLATDNRVTAASAHAILTATSEDPGTFTVSQAERWGATTIAVHPA